MPPEYPTETHEPKSKKKLILVLVLITILIAASTTLGLLYYKTKTNMQGELNSKQKAIGGLEKKNSNYLKQIEALKKTDTADTVEINNTNTHRQIPELGVQYALNDQTEDLTYSYAGDSMIYFSNINIANTDKNRDCLGSAPLGGLVKGTGDQTFLGGTTFKQQYEIAIANEQNKNNVKKVGESYFIYQGPQSACQDKAQNKVELTALMTPTARQAVITALQSFEPIE